MPELRRNIPPQVLVATHRRLPDFRPVTPDDVEVIAPYLRYSGSRSCDFTIGGIFMWVDYFGYEYCIYRDTLFIKGLSEDESRQPAFSLPMGKLPLREALAAIREYCRAERIEPLFSAIPEERVDDFRALGARAVTELPDWADYVYNATELASLTGKHYNKKRNHVNRFMSDNPGWRLDDIDGSNIGELIDFFAALDIESAKAEPAMAEFEREQCLDVLRDYDRYGMSGALLRDGNGHIVAFTAGELRGDTLVLHIEKMRHDVAGAGETVNRFFAARMLERHPELLYINREDDAGDPGLRYAKESYHPIYKLKKYNVVL